MGHRKGAWRGKPPRDDSVEIRGEVYGTKRLAALSVGVAPCTITNAIKRGALETVGLGTGQTVKFPVVIRGVEYPSVTDAANALGVHPSTVSHALAEGKQDRVGLGIDYANRRMNPAPRCAKPVTIGGMTFPSRQALAEYADRSPSYVRRVLRGKDPQLMAILMRRVMTKRLAATNAATRGIFHD